jgi:hypothetical protein
MYLVNLIDAIGEPVRQQQSALYEGFFAVIREPFDIH